MAYIRKFSVLLALCLVLALLPVTLANAAEGGSLWLRHLPQNDGVTLAVCADTAVASGVITITYDSSALAFRELTVDSAHVLAHAVNDQEAGTIKISWIGTGAHSEAVVLMRLQFAGDPLAVAELSGSVQNANGEAVAFTGLDFGAFNAAVYQAECLKAEDYTADSFAAVRAALDAANAQANVETVTQAQLDAATAALTAAMEKLVAPEPPATEPPATEPAPTEPQPTQPTQPTQPGSAPAQTDPTEPTQAPTPAPKGDNSWLLYVLAALVAVAAVVAVILKKRGKK